MPSCDVLPSVFSSFQPSSSVPQNDQHGLAKWKVHQGERESLRLGSFLSTEAHVRTASASRCWHHSLVIIDPIPWLCTYQDSVFTRDYKQMRGRKTYLQIGPTQTAVASRLAAVFTQKCPPPRRTLTLVPHSADETQRITTVFLFILRRHQDLCHLFHLFLPPVHHKGTQPEVGMPSSERTRRLSTSGDTPPTLTVLQKKTEWRALIAVVGAGSRSREPDFHTYPTPGTAARVEQTLPCQCACCCCDSHSDGRDSQDHHFLYFSSSGSRLSVVSPALCQFFDLSFSSRVATARKCPSHA